LRFGFFLHAFSAFDSAPTRARGFTTVCGDDVAATTFPAPENVALDGAPKIAGCGEGAARQASAVVHAGAGCDDWLQGAAVVHA
jgi:hypothetical protein